MFEHLRIDIIMSAFERDELFRCTRALERRNSDVHRQRVSLGED